MEFEGAAQSVLCDGQREAQPKLQHRQCAVDRAFVVREHAAHHLAKLVGLDAGRVSLLDNVAVTYSSQMENSIEAPDSVFGALDVASMKIRNGLKHKVKCLPVQV